MSLRLRRPVAFAGAVLGFVGAIGCAIGMAAALWVFVRLDRANDRAFAAVQTSLGAAQDLVGRARDRTREAAAAADGLGASVREWARGRIAPELAARFDARAGRVAERLEQAQAWADTSAASVRSVAQTIDVIRTVGGARGDDDGDGPRPLAAAADRIDDLGARLRQVAAQVEDLRQQAAAWAAATRATDRPPDDDDSDRIPRLSRLAAAVDAALRQVEARLDEAANGLAERQAGAERLRIRVHRHIALATAGAIFLLAWMAAGQAALCAYGLKHTRRVPTPSRPTASSA